MICGGIMPSSSSLSLKSSKPPFAVRGYLCREVEEVQMGKLGNTARAGRTAWVGVEQIGAALSAAEFVRVRPALQARALGPVKVREKQWQNQIDLMSRHEPRGVQHRSLDE
jgi:hypothetical protein